MNTKFETDLPLPGIGMVQSAFKDRKFERFIAYMHMTGDRVIVLKWITLNLKDNPYKIADNTLSLIEVPKQIPDLTPVILAKHFLLHPPSIDYDDNEKKFWEVVNNFNNAYSLTADDILKEVTGEEEFSSIKLQTASRMGITAEQIKAKKAFYKSVWNEHKKQQCNIV